MKRELLKPPKYREILEDLAEGIRSGKLPHGQKLPSEAMLVKRYGTSRITVGRAMRELQQRGLIERVAGSGSFVRAETPPAASPRIFGLLIPDLGETEIFEPICQGIANAPEAGEHALLWGHAGSTTSGKSRQAIQLCEQYIARQVAGVFFAPLEFEADATQINRRILRKLADAKIPVVLLDRRPADSPVSKRPDMVGINNRHAGYLATGHLISLGCKRIGFMAYHGSASTINARYTGYRDALLDHDLPVGLDADPKNHLEAYVCINDRMAGQLMHTFLNAGLRIPQDVRIVGIDDVNYASLLPVPLTTVRQPCREIGATALDAMLSRIERGPNMPARDILIDGTLVIRQSCGALDQTRSGTT